MSLIYAAQFKSNDGKVVAYHDGTIGLPGLLGKAIPAADIVDVAVEDGEALRERVTVTRMLAVGPFAWALKKKSGGTKFLLIETVDDAHLFELKNKHYREARSFAAKAMAAVRKGQAAAETATFTADVGEDEVAPAPSAGPGVAPPLPAEEPNARKWWQKTTGELINERRARKGKKPLNFDS
jgi:hypothetical protein